MFDRIRRSRYVFTVYYGGKVGNQDVEGEGQRGVASLLPLARRQMDRDRHLGRVSTRDQSLIVSNVTYVYYKIVYEKSNAVSSFPFSSNHRYTPPLSHFPQFREPASK